MGATTTDQELGTNSSFTPQNGTSPSTTKEFPYIIILPILLVTIGLMGYFLVFAISIWSKRIKMHQHAFLLSLAVADTLFLGLVMPFIIRVMLDGEWTSGDWACKLQGYLLGLSCHASLCSIASIALNRYVSVVHIAYYRTLYSTRNIILIIACVWVYCLLLPFPSLLGWGRISFSELTDACLYDWGYSRSYTYTLLGFGYLLPTLVIIYCYLRIWITFRKSRQRVHSRSNAVQSLGVSPAKIRKEDLRLAVQLVALFLVFIVCWTPYLILAALIDPHGKGSRTAYDITSNLLLLNAIIDPAFYFFFNDTLRMDAVELFRWIFCVPKKNTIENRRPTDTSSRY